MGNNPSGSSKSGGGNVFSPSKKSSSGGGGGNFLISPHKAFASIAEEAREALQGEDSGPLSISGINNNNSRKNSKNNGSSNNNSDGAQTKGSGIGVAGTKMATNDVKLCNYKSANTKQRRNTYYEKCHPYSG